MLTVLLLFPLIMYGYPVIVSAPNAIPAQAAPSVSLVIDTPKRPVIAKLLASPFIPRQEDAVMPRFFQSVRM